MASCRVSRAVLELRRTDSESSGLESAAAGVWFRIGVVEKSVGRFSLAVAGAEEYSRALWNRDKRNSFGSRNRDRERIEGGIRIGKKARSV